MTKQLKFVCNDGPYSPGDIAGFPDDIAEKYLRRKTAELAFESVAPVEVAIDAEVPSPAPVTQEHPLTDSYRVVTKGRGRK